MQYSSYHTFESSSKAEYRIKVSENWGYYFFSLVDYLSPSSDYDDIVFGYLLVQKNGILYRPNRVKGYTGSGYWCLNDKKASRKAKKIANKLKLSEKSLPIITRYDDTKDKEKIYLKGTDGEDIEFRAYITDGLSQIYLKEQLSTLIEK